MSSVQPLPPKKDVALALLERSSVHIHLDPRVSSVIVPSWFKNQPQLVLQVGLNMPVPIPDLRLDDDGLSCTLSFNRAPFHCVVPWTSVFAMVGDDGRGMVWPEDLPPEVARQAQARAPQHAPSLVPRLQDAAAPSDKADKADAAQAEPDSAAPTPRVKKKKADLREAPPSKGPDSAKADSSKAGEAESADDGKTKKPRKKPRIVPNPEAENRARLVAVPAPAVSDPRPPRAEPRGTPGSSTPRQQGAPAASTPRAGGGKKRELPPYLRVVK
jgi:stringent starvation protein B